MNVKQVKFKIHLLPSKKEEPPKQEEDGGEGTEGTEGSEDVEEVSPTKEIEDKGGCMIYGLVIEGCNQTVLPTFCAEISQSGQHCDSALQNIGNQMVSLLNHFRCTLE